MDSYWNATIAACFPKGTTARAATGEIRTKHSAIAGYFETARGLGFMCIESDILVATLLSLMKRGITALPLHDAVLVPEHYAKIAKATLQRESKRRIACVHRQTGHLISHRVAHIARYRDGKVVYFRVINDSLDAAEQFIGHRINLKDEAVSTSSDLVPFELAPALTPI